MTSKLQKDMRTLADMAANAPKYDGPDVSHFWGGYVQDVFILGEYAIVQYMPKKASNAPKDWKPTPMFTGYVRETPQRRNISYDKNGWKSTNHSFDSLEAATVHTFAYKVLGPNTQAGYLFMKMIAPEPERS